jgi:hypothetical protein
VIEMSGVQTYIKKPVAIQAIQWTGMNLKQVIEFIGLHPSASKWTWDEYELKIFTMEGPLRATIGDFIIRGIKGEFYPCKPDIFEATYEQAEPGYKPVWRKDEKNEPT